jgi:polyhydroxybutyrate depolymerase
MRRFALAITLAACSSTPPERPKVFGGDRPVTLQVPEPFDEHRKYPLVLVLHGYSANGFVQEVFFGMNYLPKMGEAFVLAPDGLVDSLGNQYWNADPACCDFDHTNPDDSGYLSGLVEDVSAAWPVDRGAVVALGHSNGGYMAYRLACDHADLFPNIMVLAGAAASDPSTCNPTQPVSVLHLHGTDDAEVPYDPNANASVTQWAGFDGCAQTRTAGAALDLDQVQTGAETTTATFDGCPPDITVELWTIQGAGHVPSFDTMTISALLFDYLGAHRR